MVIAVLKYLQFFLLQTSLFIIKTCRSVPDMYYILYCKFKEIFLLFISAFRRKSLALAVPRNNIGLSELLL